MLNEKKNFNSVTETYLWFIKYCVNILFIKIWLLDKIVVCY